MRKKQPEVELCGDEKTLRHGTWSMCKTTHSCKREKGHRGSHACLEIRATKKPCDVKWTPSRRLSELIGAK